MVKHFLNLMFSNPSHETSETVHDRKMGIFAVNDEMNLAFSLIVQMTSNLLSWDFFQTKVTFKLCKIADTKVHIIWREAEKHLTRLCPGEPSLIYVHFQCRLRLQPGFLVGVSEICSCTHQNHRSTGRCRGIPLIHCASRTTRTWHRCLVLIKNS